MDDMLEREDSEMLMTQAAVDAMPLPRKSFMARRPSVVQFAELRQAVAQESQPEASAFSPGPAAASGSLPATKSKFQVRPSPVLSDVLRDFC